MKHILSSIADFDPRQEEYRGTALSCLQEFLQKVKGGLGVSVPYSIRIPRVFLTRAAVPVSSIFMATQIKFSLNLISCREGT